jgi:hypothetical protein
MSDKILKIGDTVVWRAMFGTALPLHAKIKGITLCESERMKSGIEVGEAFWKEKNRLCVGLTNGSWAYGYQISPISEA